MKYQKRVTYKQHKCISHSSRDWNFCIKLPAWLGSGESFSSFQTANFSLYPHVAKRGLDCSFTSSYKGTNPIHEPLTLLNKLPSKVPTSKYYNIEIRILTWILQEMGTKHSVHCCWSLHDFIIFILLLLTFSCDLIKCVLL